jgi:BTB/POZ domain-containing protein KCTD9
MSALTEALEKILKYHVLHNEEVASKLRPGLTRGEIDELVKDLPFTLPEEAYELYQWRNGTEGAYPCSWLQFIFDRCGVHGFLSLEEALKISQESYQDYQRNKNFRSARDKFEPNWLLMFTSASDNTSAGRVLVLGEDTAPIRCYDPEDGCYEIVYTSLTNMMLGQLHSDLSGADFRNADFRNIRLHRIILKGANLEGADFTGANLTFTNLCEANLKGAKLAKALYSLQTIFPDGTDLSESIFVGAGANLSGVNLDGVYLNDMDLRSANLSGACLKGNYINDANLEDANLTGANLERAILDGANLKGANLTGANLWGTKMKRTNLANANLYGAKLELFWIQSDNPIFYNTVIPDGSIKNPSY